MYIIRMRETLQFRITCRQAATNYSGKSFSTTRQGDNLKRDRLKATLTLCREDKANSQSSKFRGLRVG